MANSQTFTFNIKAVADMKDVVSNISNIQSALSKLKLPDNLKNSFKQTFNNLDKELENYQRLMNSGFKTKGDTNALTKSGNNILRLYDDIVQKINSIDDSTLKKAFEDLGAAEVQKLRDELNGLEADLKSKLGNQKFINFDATKNELKSLKTQISALGSDAEKAFKTLSGSTLNTLFKNIDAGRFDLAEKNLDSIRQKVEQINNTDLTKWYTQLSEGFSALQQDSSISETTNKINELKQSLTSIEASTLQKLVEQFKQGTISVDQFQKEVNELVTSTNEWGQAQAQANKEISQVKSRIQYFFGINNAINLVKRAIRGAVDTIKELDKAMTETAVVTDFTVSDMWKQLPEYTKRANELGVTTQAAYEAATLYYQQGLKTEEVNALSVETLKMARIAGLDAAEATDRMTNALRGFNMELDAQSAQRVDDVYSELAANTASNVDEISTAMTKVASLAHSANMEFETTAAFLAQIIETTRESAETAGTALKTVVARFSEVKKLVDTNQLKGQDEEGQVVDVNKVSAALRTAGIDLNKYFLGEVGLDDIFMELASKWDSLTSVQQRYIATQAAGSRQQSRFIALMQDYARTQELVGKAYNAEGASARQFEKTQDSLESKLARLKNAWNEFLMGLTNNVMVKSFVDALTDLLNLVNKLTSAFGDGIGTILKWGFAITGLVGLKKAFSDTGIATKAIGALFKGTPLGKLFGLDSGKGEETTANLSMIEQIKAAWLAAIEQVKAAAIASETEESVAATEAEVSESTVAAEAEVAEATTAAEAEIAESAAATEAEIAESATAAQAEIAQNLSATGARVSTAAGVGVGTSAASIGASAAGAGAGAAGAGAAGAGAAGAGAAGAVAVPAAIIATIVAAVIGTVAIQNYLKSGLKQVKDAEHVVENQQKTAEKQKEVAEKQKEAYNKYLENEKLLKSSSNNAERTEAKAGMAEALAILAGIDKNNIITTDNGPILNKGYAKQRTEQLEAEQTLTEASGNFAQAILQTAEANKAEKSIRDNTAYGIYGQWNNRGGSWWEDTKWDLSHIGLTAEEKYYATLQHNAEQQAKAENYRAAAQPELMAAAASLLKEKYDENIIDNVASAYGKLVNAIDFQEQLKQTSGVGRFGGRDNIFNKNSLKQEYEAIYGTGSAKDLKVNELSTALAQRDITLKQQANVEQLAKLALDKNGSIILDIINGTFDQFYQGGELESALSKLSPQHQEALRKVLDVEVDELQDTLAQYGEQLVKAQTKIRKNTIRVLTKAGIKNSQYLDQVSTQLTMSQQTELSKVVETLSGYGLQVNDAVAQTFSNALLDNTYEETFKDFVESISDNPILAYDTLKQAAEGTNQELRSLVEQLGLINKVSGKFDVSGFEQFSRQNLVQSFFASDAYDNLTDQVEKFIEANGRITSANIEELSDECNTLSILLDNDIMSAEGLAIAFSALAEGNITLLDLNENVLELYNSFDTVANAIQRAGQFIKDFDPGEDWGDAFDFIDGAIEKMQGFIDNRELGNPQLRNYWKAFFTTDPKDLEDWEAGLAVLKELQGNGGADFWTKAVGFSMDENGVITDMGINAFASSPGFNNYRDYIKNLAKSNGFTKFTDEYYDLMIRNMGDHDYGVLTDIAAVEMDKMMTAYGEGMPSKTDIQAIADGYGIEPQDVLDAWSAKYGDGTQLDFSELEDKIRRTTTSIKDVAKTALSDLREDFINGRIGLGDTEGEASSAWNANMGNTSWILQQLGIGSDGTFSIDTLYAKIGQIVPEVQDGTMSPQEWIQEQIDKSPDGKVTLPVDFDYQKKIDDNQYETQHFHADVEIDSVEGYEKAVSDAMAEANAVSLSQPIQDAITEANSLAEIISALGTENSISEVKGEISNCITDANTLNTALGQTINKTVHVSAEPSSIEISGAGGTISFSISAVASGGIVKSAAGGTVSPGLALTGEEAPEIVWNKQKGYAYLAGKNGPEINNLQPGDEVFNGEQTKQILKRSGISSFAKGTINSYAGTIWKTDDTGSGSSGSGSGRKKSGSDKEKTPEEWKNELDWLYNLMENIVELERDQSKLQEKYDDLLTDQTKTGRDLYNLLIDQLGNLYAQLDNQTYALERREQEMREFMDTTNDKDQYLWYNWQDRTLEIDWDAIDRITDEEEYKHVKELVDEAEDIQDKMDDAEDAVLDINNQIQELENIWRDTFTDFEDRVLKAVVQMYQNVIDNYSELNDTLNNSNTSILDAINKEISLQRQIRDNAKTEEEITNTEAQLAYLRRDTTGGNELAALQTEKSLDETRQNYEDNLVDQAVQRLQEDNDAAAQQRERQIEIMQAQLDYQSENGEFNAYVRELLETAMDGDGHLATDSDLYKLLAEQENMAAMTDVQRQVWEEELNGTFKEVLAFLLKEQGQAEGTYFTAVTAAFNNISDTFNKAFHGSYSQGSHNGGSSGGGSSGGGSGGSGGSGSGSSISSGSGTQSNEDITNIIKKKRFSGSGGGGGCFAPGTKILMADYSFKNIEDVCTGEYVISYNELTLSYEPKKVLHSFAHYNTNEIIDIYLSNNIVLTATKCHPILTTDGWKSLNHDIALYEHGIETKPLLKGQTVIGFEENYEIIQIIDRNDLNSSTTYNITIEDNHTYIANNCIVHNMRVAASIMKYATGGLATTTGPAWLDGTPSEPEYVLNARQTDAFLKLADVLPNIMNNSSATMNTFGGNTINIAVQLDSVSPDYDVDRMVDAVKEKLYDSGSYRNVNSISFLR